MNQPQHSSQWRRWIALASLFSVLLLSVASASHVHGSANGSGVRQECKLCVTGSVDPILTAGTLLSGALLVTLFLLPVPAIHPPSTRRYQPGHPRSPPPHL
ncbi:MAG: hypothetical protein ACRERD_24720 [Candidatus Binatia bacterium]